MTTFYLPEDWDAVLESRTPGVTTIEKTPPIKYQGRAPIASGDDLLMFNTQNLTMEAQRANQLNEKLLRPPLETGSIQRPDVGPQSTLTDEDRAIVAPEMPSATRLPSPVFDITNQAGRFAQPQLRRADAPRRGGGAAPLTIDPHRAKAMAESAVGAVKSFGTNLRDDVLRLANRQPGSEFTKEDAGAGLRSGPGMLMPLFGRAAGLGAAGGRLAATAANEAVTVERVVAEAKAMGLKTKVRVHQKQNTSYVTITRYDPAGSIKLTVRVPADARSHPGRRMYAQESVIDATAATRNVDPSIAANVEGERFTNMSAVRDAMKYRFSRGTAEDPNWLVAPGREQVPMRPPTETPAPMPSDPDQLRLLSAGAPVGAVWDAVLEPASP